MPEKGVNAVYKAARAVGKLEAFRFDDATLDALRGEIGVLMPSADTVELERAFVKVFDRFGGLGFSEFLGGMAGTFPQEAGESALQMYGSPEAMQKSAGERLAIASGKGVVNSALESLVPSMMVGKLTRGLAPELQKGVIPALKYVGKQGLIAGAEESGTEGLQSVTGQMAMHLAAPKTEDLLPSGEELLTSMASGFVPGKAMGMMGDRMMANCPMMGGTPKAADAIKGAVMRETKGRADGGDVTDSRHWIDDFAAAQASHHFDHQRGDGQYDPENEM